MLNCREDNVVDLPKGLEVLIKYAEDSNGLNSSSTPSSAANYISFSTDGGLIWSIWKLYAGSSSGGSISGSGRLFSRFGTHTLGNGVGSYSGFTDGSYTLTYIAPADELAIAGDSFEIEALFRFKNIYSSSIRKFAIQISNTGGTVTIPFETLTNGTGDYFDVVVKGLYTMASLPSNGYHSFTSTTVGSPNVNETSPLSLYNLISASNPITITPVGDNVTTDGNETDRISCIYLTVHKQ